MRTASVAIVVLLAGAARGAEPASGDPWAGKPVWVASTVAYLYDISPDGKRLLYSDGRKFGCFDRTTNKMAWQIDNGTIHSAAFSPNGRTIVAGEWQNGLILYDAADGKKLFSFVPEGNERIWQAMFRPDGTILYQSYDSGSSIKPPWTKSYTIVHWDPVARKDIARIADSYQYDKSNVWLWHRGTGFFMERYELHGGDTPTHATVRYTDPLTGKTTPDVKIDAGDNVFDLSADGKAVLVRLAGNSPRVIDTTTGKVLLTLDGHKAMVTWAAFSPDGKLIATVSGTEQSNFDRGRSAVRTSNGPAELVVWDAKTGKAISRSEFPTKELDFVQARFSPDSKFLVALCRDGTDRKERKLVAFGAVPFDAKGGSELNFPQDEALKPKPKAVVTPKGPGVVADPLDKLIEDLAKSAKPAKDKIDYLFVALLGRFATQTELKRIGEKYPGTFTLPILQAIATEIATTPEFEAHIKSLEKRKAKPAAPVEGYDFWPGTGRPNIIIPYGWSPSEVYPFGWPRKPPAPPSPPILDPMKP